MPTLKDVLEAFDSFGDQVIQQMALVRAMEKRGFEIDAVPTAIREAIASGHLAYTDASGIRRS